MDCMKYELLESGNGISPRTGKMGWSTTVTYIKVENMKLPVEIKSHLQSDQAHQPISPPSKEQGLHPSEA